MNIIGLGNVGGRVAIRITEHNKAVYNTFLIDTIKHKGAKSKKIDKQATPEMYEENYKSCKIPENESDCNSSTYITRTGMC